MPTLLSYNLINYLANVRSKKAVSSILLAMPTLQNLGKSVYPYIYLYISQTIVGFFEALVWKNGLRYGFKFFCASTLLAQYKVTKFSSSYDNIKLGFETPEKRDFCKFARNSYSSTGKPFYNVMLDLSI